MTVSTEDHGRRLDLFVADKGLVLSRSQSAQFIKNGFVTVDGEASKPKHKVRHGECVRVVVPETKPLTVVPEAIDLEVIHADEDLVVVNKQRGLVVHPAAGHESGTLVNALLHHFPHMEGIGGELRPGIVHRLDKDTTGLLVVALNQKTHLELTRQFKEREVSKRYRALVYGEVPEDRGIIDRPIGRDPRDRKRMGVNSPTGRASETHYAVLERYPGASLLDVDLKTGRTHQIRVHTQWLGHPVVGDPVYTRRKADRGLPQVAALRSAIRGLSGQLLHAHTLSLCHPGTGQRMTWTAPLPEDFSAVVSLLAP
ncbi:RluA family pseudouridine synthase [Desulfoluna spongiiphila]|uniref:RluA family pseudouridine synthase n=1 Tax=Desulfoluna spongiiphila TaxID=419481 RepID=UPI001257E72F|nr:RluA family pseudouridine synthase [Desulfoluna spongiiphila]VVS93592.1 pseudouridine synthase rluc/rlud [Desulfoluna spongiiphila]